MLERDGQPLSYGQMRNDFHEELKQQGEKIQAEPLEFLGDSVFHRFFVQPEAAAGEPLHVTKIRNPRPGKPDPRTWGWQSTDGSAPPGLDP